MLTMTGNLLSETAVRALRDKVYERPSSDRNWEASKAEWMTPENTAWLEEKSKPKSKPT